MRWWLPCCLETELSACLGPGAQQGRAVLANLPENSLPLLKAHRVQGVFQNSSFPFALGCVAEPVSVSFPSRDQIKAFVMSYGFHAWDFSFEFTEVVSATAARKGGGKSFCLQRHTPANTELCHLLAE